MPALHYLSRPILEVSGRKAPTDHLMSTLMEDLLEVVVEESLTLPGMFTLIIHNDYFPGRTKEKPWPYDDLLTIGASVKIGFSTSTTTAQDFNRSDESYVLDGEITALEAQFSDGAQAPVIVRGYDSSHRLHRGRYNRSFQNMTDSDIIQKIVKSVGLDLGTLEDSGLTHEYVFQENQTNMAFLRERAARIGFELFVQDGKLHFRKPQANQTLNLRWLKDLHHFHTRVTSAEQVDTVEVRAWDYTAKKPIVATATTGHPLTRTDQGQGRTTSTRFDLDREPPRLTVVDRPLASPKAADTLAQVLADEVGGEFVQADARGEGNPKIRPGKTVKLEELGRFTGDYYITETRHHYHENIYHTEFSVRGLRGGNLFDTLIPQTRLKPGQTFLVGIVTDNQDPKSWGRVKVKFPTLTEEHASTWARVIGAGAADGRGFDCLPEINDEVLVAFEHGDIHRPYILGGVWNGQDAPPEAVGDSIQDGQVRLRTFKTRTGHILQFVEEDKGSSKSGVHIQTSGGHSLYLNDSDRKVEVQTSGGHSLTLDDGGSSIAMSSTGSITLDARTTIDIRANGIITVNGLLIKLN